jgi:hypothetical protein
VLYEDAAYIPDEIKIVDTPERKKYLEVSTDVVHVSGRWYWKNSPKVILVEGIHNGTWVRKDSKQYVRDINGNNIHIDVAIKLAFNRGWAARRSDSYYKVGRKWLFADEVAVIDDVRYWVGDPRIVRLVTGRYAFKSECVRLSKEYYAGTSFTVMDVKYDKENNFNVWVKKTDIVDELSPSHNTWATRRDAVYADDINPLIDKKHLILKYERYKYYNVEMDKLFSLHNSHMSGEGVETFIYGIKDGINCHENELAILSGAIEQHYIIDHRDGFEWIDELNGWCLAHKYQSILDRFIGDKEEYNRKNLETARYEANKHYHEVGSDENNATNVDVLWVRPRGGREIYDGRPSLKKSPSSKKFASMQYTFGVEIETSHGRISDDKLNDLGIAIVSDGSIRGGEYITPPLHGDLGYRFLKKVMDVVSEETFVNNECAIHAHISGAKFNRRFSILAVKLGTQLEKPLFMMQPQSKHPVNKYCAGIAKCYGEDPNDGVEWSQSYRHLDFNNWRRVLGNYVFGRSFSEEFNSLTEQFRWCEGRYKWLNLVNCNSLGRFETIEFRLFGGTTSFDKVYNYVLISMAFVWFVENKQQRIIDGNVTLKEVIDSAFSRRHDIRDRVNKFITERTIKFNRNDI